MQNLDNSALNSMKKTANKVLKESHDYDRGLISVQPGCSKTYNTLSIVKSKNYKLCLVFSPNMIHTQIKQTLIEQLNYSEIDIGVISDLFDKNKRLSKKIILINYNQYLKCKKEVEKLIEDNIVDGILCDEYYRMDGIYDTLAKAKQWWAVLPHIANDMCIFSTNYQVIISIGADFTKDFDNRISVTKYLPDQIRNSISSTKN
jgi:hypothetical protein